MAANGVNAIDVFARTITSADPEILQSELFRSAFGGFGLAEESVMGNIRHEVFGALLLAAVPVVGLPAAAARSRPGCSQRLYLLGQGLAVLLLLLSMSRSVILALAAWPLLGLLHAAALGRPDHAALRRRRRSS